LLSSATKEGEAEKSRKPYTSLKFGHIRIIHELAAILTYRYFKTLLPLCCLYQEQTTHVL
jgi:hypothetical protein